MEREKSILNADGSMDIYLAPSLPAQTRTGWPPPQAKAGSLSFVPTALSRASGEDGREGEMVKEPEAAFC